ncbi:MAG TPA: NfeD family protein [Polyangiales bacterium]|nr:NfeD family protein [Polyangiales bacterium]
MRARRAWLLFACLWVATQARAGQPLVLHVELRGVVNPVKVRHLKQALERATRERADLVLLSIDTPGGLVTSMQDIVSDISNSKVPVVGFVEPRSAQATSAGALILLATDVAAMLPDTRVGAAHPVGAGEKLEGAVEEKATNSLASLARSLAARRGRPQDLAAGMVRESTSYTAQEAKDKGLIELIVSDEADLLRQLEGRKLAFADRSLTLHTQAAKRIEVELSWSNELLDAIANPTLSSILLSLGVLGLTYELMAPGIGLGGILGLVSLCLGLLGMSVLPLQTVGFVLFVGGLIALGLEFAMPTHGLLGLGGVLSLAAAALVMIDEGSYFGGVQRIDLRLFVPVIVAVALFLVALVTVTRKAMRAPPQLGPAALTGKHGTAKTAFVRKDAEFTGSVFVDGALWQAIAGAEIAQGDAIEVVEVSTAPMQLTVRRKGAHS